MLSSNLFRSRIHTDQVSRSEKILGYFLGPIGVSLISSFLGSYLNVFFTDVLGLATLWNGLFLSLLPMVGTAAAALSTLFFGRIADRTASPQGKARPWILLATPVLLLGFLLLFSSPDSNNLFHASWILISYLIYYAVGNAAYTTSHNLMVPLSTKNVTERSSLSLLTNAVVMIPGTLVAVLFPTLLLPRIGVDQQAWQAFALILAAIATPLMLAEYYFTRERVTEANQTASVSSTSDRSSMHQQLHLCAKSPQWLTYVAYLLITTLFNQLSNASIFYYCNWVLGEYNDGITQMLFYAIGNAPLGFGVFLCQPLCRKLGRYRAMIYGFCLAAVGGFLCLLAPTNLFLVLAGQFMKATGLIPSTFLVNTLMADALDDVERTNQCRLDGFSSSAFAIITTLASGAAVGIFNLCLGLFGYQPPAGEAAGLIPVQNNLVQGFFIFCSLGAPLISSLLLAVLLKRASKRNQ